MPKRKVTDDQIETQLILCGGVIKTTAQKLGMSPQAIQQRIAVNQNLLDAKEKGRQRIVDEAESQLFKAVRKGQPWAVRLSLTRLGRDRGYGNRIEVDATGAAGILLAMPDDGRESNADQSRTAARAAGNGPEITS